LIKDLKGDLHTVGTKTAKVVSLHDYYLKHPEKKRRNSLLNNYGDETGVIFTPTQVSFVHVESIVTPSGLVFSDPVQVSMYANSSRADQNRTRVFWMDKIRNIFR
jgi:hypothetical protein